MKLSKVDLCFYPENPALDIPNHLFFQWTDNQGRRCKYILDVPEHVVQELSEFSFNSNH